MPLSPRSCHVHAKTSVTAERNQQTNLWLACYVTGQQWPGLGSDWLLQVPVLVRFLPFISDLKVLTFKATVNILVIRFQITKVWGKYMVERKLNKATCGCQGWWLIEKGTKWRWFSPEEKFPRETHIWKGWGCLFSLPDRWKPFSVTKHPVWKRVSKVELSTRLSLSSCRNREEIVEF